MPIKIFGVSHKTAPIDVREQLTVDPERLPETLSGVVSGGGASEALILSTCNRTELYCNVPPVSGHRAFDWLVGQTDADTAVVDRHRYEFENEYAVRHVLRVACGLDSMVLGEPQILGQLKGAYQVAVGQGTVGKTLNKLFQHSFHVAKQVRSKTAIGENPVSVAFAAVKLARQIHGDLNTKTAVLVGAGETINLVAHHLRSHQIAKLVVANRTRERSAELAERFQGESIALDELPARLHEADIVVSSTASRLPVITRHAVEQAVAARRHSPMFIVDLAVPRDVETDAADVEDVYLYSVDDLHQVVQENTRLREAAAAQAEDLINLQAESYMEWLQGQDSTSSIVAIREQAHAMKQELTDKAMKRLAAGDDAETVIAGLANSLVNKLLHQPTIKMREAGMEGDDEMVRIAREIFEQRKS